MGSERTNNATPVNTGHAYMRQISNGVVSEFNPLIATDEHLREDAEAGLRQSENAAAMHILRDNYLKTQNVLNGVKLVGMDSNPSSPLTNGPMGLKSRTRQLQLSQGQMVSNKNRRLTSSSSTSNIP